LFITDIVHFLRGNPLDQTKWKRLVQRLDLQRAVAITASLLPIPEQAMLAGDAGPGVTLPQETARLLMLQPASGRSQLKLQATLSDTAPAGRLAVLAGKLVPGRALLRRRWQSERGSLERAPHAAVLWLWYLGRKARQYLTPRSRREHSTLEGLRDLRRRLSDESRRP
jgi:hypothetical protein